MLPMDDFCPPFLEISEIKKKVEDFRSRFPRCNKFPIDMEALLEQDLQIFDPANKNACEVLF